MGRDERLLKQNIRNILVKNLKTFKKMAIKLFISIVLFCVSMSMFIWAYHFKHRNDDDVIVPRTYIFWSIFWSIVFGTIPLLF